MRDNFERTIDYLRVSITDLCNYKCQYCMPDDSTNCRGEESCSLEDLLKIISVFVELGIKKVRITGGEPLIRPGVLSFIEDIKKLGVEEIAMTTNGALLYEMAEDLKKAGLNRVNISLDTLEEEKFKKLTRGGDLEKVLKGIKKAQEVGLTPVKINTVLMRDFNDNEVEDLIYWSTENDLILRFIELMPIGEALSFKEKFLSVDEIKTKDFKRIKGERSSPAKYYSYKNKGTIGFIEPMTDHFCGDCNRLRLDSQANIIPCLHSDLKINLSEFINNKDKLKEKIVESLLLKPEKHLLKEGNYKKDHMHRIGG